MKNNESSKGRNLPEVEINHLGYVTTINYKENSISTNAPDEKWTDILRYLYDEGYIVSPDGESVSTPSDGVIETTIEKALERYEDYKEEYGELGEESVEKSVEEGVTAIKDKPSENKGLNFMDMLD